MPRREFLSILTLRGILIQEISMRNFLFVFAATLLISGLANADQYDAAYKGVLELDTQTSDPASGDWIERYDVSADKFVKVDASTAAASPSVVDIDSGTIDGVTMGASTAIISLVATTADINAGTFDGIVGGTTPADGSFTTLSTTGAATLGSTTALNGDVTVADDIALEFGDSVDFKIEFDATAGILTSGPATLLWANAPSRLSSDPYTFYEINEDFMNAASATASEYHAWVTIDDSGTGTNAFQDAAGGVYNVVTAAQADDYHTMESDGELFLIADGKKIWCEARVKVNEAATNDSAWIFGLMDDTTTGGLQTGTQGPLGTYDGIVLWVDEASLDVDFETSNASTQATTTAIATSVTNTWTRVGFHCDGASTTTVCTPYVAVNDSATLVVGTAQNITTSGMTEMNMIFGIKSGGSVETLQVDYAICKQLR